MQDHQQVSPFFRAGGNVAAFIFATPPGLVVKNGCCCEKSKTQSSSLGSRPSLSSCVAAVSSFAISPGNLVKSMVTALLDNKARMAPMASGDLRNMLSVCMLSNKVVGMCCAILCLVCEVVPSAGSLGSRIL